MAARQLEVSAASIQKLLGVADKFAAETFVPFEQGGRLAPDSITRFRQQLAQLEAAIEVTRCGRHLWRVSSAGTAWMPWRLHMIVAGLAGTAGGSELSLAGLAPCGGVQCSACSWLLCTG